MGAEPLILLFLVGGGLYLLHQTQQLPGAGVPTGGPNGAPIGTQINIDTSDQPKKGGNTPGFGGGGGSNGGGGSIGRSAGNGSYQPGIEDSQHPGAAYSNTPLDGQESYAASGAGERLSEPQLGDSLPGSPGSIDSVQGQVGQALSPGELSLSGSNDYAADQAAAGNNFQLTPPTLGSPGGLFGGGGNGEDPNYDPYDDSQYTEGNF